MLSNQMVMVIERLRQLGKGEVQPVRISCGICSELSDTFEYYIDDNIFRKWPKFSGDTEYPVKHPTLSAKTAYLGVSFSMVYQKLWSDGEYGDNRRELCLWLADELEKGEKS